MILGQPTGAARSVITYLPGPACDCFFSALKPDTFNGFQCTFQYLYLFIYLWRKENIWTLCKNRLCMTSRVGILRNFFHELVLKINLLFMIDKIAKLIFISYFRLIWFNFLLCSRNIYLVLLAHKKMTSGIANSSMDVFLLKLLSELQSYEYISG